MGQVMHNEKAMIEAHKQGRAYALEPDATLAVAKTIADAFDTGDERYSFIAGFIGERQRLERKAP
jgi:hypothetical protein